MNIIGNKKRIAILGNGTAGCVAASQLTLHQSSSEYELVWYYSPKVQAQSVGEGSILGFPQLNRESLDWGYKELKKIDGTFKHGIRKINWGGSGDFIHPFPLDSCGLHFNATKFQKYAQKTLASRGTLIEKHIEDHNQIDCDHIIDCSGSPKQYSDYNISPYIPVNAAYVTQCYWEYPRFDYTLTIARPYGWVFGIPLQNRCSIGYLYDQNINSLEEVKEDVKSIFSDYNLTPSQDVRSLSFKNYYRKQNFSKRVTYNGNASFFLEPIEATSVGMMMDINLKSLGIVFKEFDVEEQNFLYNEYTKEIQFMIMLHYLAGSKFNTKFWEIAQQKAQKIFEKDVPINFKKVYERCKYYQDIGRTNIMSNEIDPFINVAQWSIESFNINLKELNLYNKIDKLLNI